MSKKRANRNTKKTLKALKQKRAKFNTAGNVAGASSDPDKDILRNKTKNEKNFAENLFGVLGDAVRTVGRVATAPVRAVGNVVTGNSSDTGQAESRGIYGQTDANIAASEAERVSNPRGIYAQTEANIAEQATTKPYSMAGRQALAQRQAGMGNVTTGNISMGGRKATNDYQDGEQRQDQPQGGQGANTGGQQQQPTSTASTVQPVVTNPAGEGAGTMTTSQSTRYVNNKLVKGAPSISIDAESPDAPTASAVSELAVDSNFMTNEAKNKAGLSTVVEQLDAPNPVTATGATAGVATTVSAALTEAISPEDFEAAGYTSVQAKELAATKAAEGSLSPEAIAKVTEVGDLSERAVGQTTTAAQKESTLAKESDFKIDPAAFVGEVTGKTAAVSPTKDAEAKTRRAILGSAADDGQAAKIIDTVGYDAAQRRTVTGTAAKGGAASMVAAVGNLPPEITASIVEDPASVTAQLDEQPVEVRAAVAALPTEALVSSQMDTLLGGMEDGEIPLWARPAVAAVEANLAKRGLSTSTVGRDALFNSIIQSALPMAQSNAQALQTRAAQNLSNEQQANLQQSTLDMQRRMANLTNRQGAESQSAQMAQQMKVLQSQNNQQAVMTSAQMQQQTRTQNLQNQQQAAVLNAQQQQASNAQNLGNEQQMELANLQIEDSTQRENMTAENQERLVEMQVAADFLAKNAGFQQQMNLANLTNEQQMRLANLSAQNQAGSENLSAAQQTELANLNKNMQTNLTAAKIAADMNQAQLNVDQQRAIQNASMVANVDLTKFNAAQQVQLANSKAMQTLVLADLNNAQQATLQNATAMASLDLATVDQRTKIAVSNAQNFLQMDMANLNNEQQAIMFDQQAKQQRILSDQGAANAALQFNATSENQVNQFLASTEAAMNQFNASQANSMSTFNATEKNRASAINAQNATDVSKFNSQLTLNADQFNEQMSLQRDTWNAANAQAVEQSNIEWRRKANTIDTAATNASNMLNAQQVFQMDSAEQAFIWQTLRDEAAYVRTSYENNQQRQTTLYATALANETATGAATTTTGVNNLFALVGGVMGGNS